MNRRQVTAVVVGLASMILALGPPLYVRATGSEVTLQIRPVDPFSIFRGNYLDLRYDVPVPGGTTEFEGEAVYAVFADERPGRLLRITDRRPDVAENEFCIRARARYGELEFPNLEQFYVSSERAAEIEQNISDYLAVLDVTTSCRAVLVDLEQR